MSVHEASRGPAPGGGAGDGGRLRGARVLVVDDDPDAREVLTLSLELAGARVRTASGARSALPMVRAWGPAVVLADLAMPDGDGFELMDGIRRLPGGNALPVVAVTGSGNPQARSRTRAAGFWAHIEKPVPVDELLALLARLIPARSRFDGPPR